MGKIVLKNARIVLPNRIGKGTVVISDGKIKKFIKEKYFQIQME